MNEIFEKQFKLIFHDFYSEFQHKTQDASVDVGIAQCIGNLSFSTKSAHSFVKNTQFFRKRLMLSQTRFLFSAKVFSMALVIFPSPS